MNIPRKRWLSFVSGGESLKKADSNGFMEIMHDIFHMPKIMLQLGLCQFFAWFALYSMWVYSTPAIAEHVYGATDPASAEYAMAGDKVGELFSIYNFVAIIRFIIDPDCPSFRSENDSCPLFMPARRGRAGFSHLLNSTGMMVFSMIGIGIAWASILAMPYAILSDSLPQIRWVLIWVYLISFITIPQITNGIIHGWIVRNVYHGHAVFALLTGGVFLVFSPLPQLVLSKRKSSVEKCKRYISPVSCCQA